MLLDCHTHHPAPQPEGIICLSPAEYATLETEGKLLPGQNYSVGIHPWKTMESPSPEEWDILGRSAEADNVVAIGEAGIDTLKGGPMFRQLEVLRRQIEISERALKPLIIHDVKAHDVLVGLRRDLNPEQPWVIHGFRGKPSVAQMLLNAGMYLSFGEKFNPESLTLSLTQEGRTLAETDESPLSIREIISPLSDSAGRDLTNEIAANTNNLFA